MGIAAGNMVDFMELKQTDRDFLDDFRSLSLDDFRFLDDFRYC